MAGGLGRHTEDSMGVATKRVGALAPNTSLGTSEKKALT